MLTIKILGPGCANCHRLEQVARKAVEAAHLEAEIIKVSDMKDIVACGVLQTPGLMINDKLVSSGRIPTPASVAQWLAEAGSSA